MADQAVPDAPGWIKGRALERWTELWPVLERSRIHPVMHRDIVAQYCIAYGDMREALEALQRSKLVKETRTVGVGDKAKTSVEKISVSPFHAIYMAAVREMDRLGKMIGLDPQNPLEVTRKFSDYSHMLYEENEGGPVDDGSASGNGGAGDASGPASTGDAGSGTDQGKVSPDSAG